MLLKIAKYVDIAKGTKIISVGKNNSTSNHTMPDQIPMSIEVSLTSVETAPRSGKVLRVIRSHGIDSFSCSI